MTTCFSVSGTHIYGKNNFSVPSNEDKENEGVAATASAPPHVVARNTAASGSNGTPPLEGAVSDGYAPQWSLEAEEAKPLSEMFVVKFILFSQFPVSYFLMHFISSLVENEVAGFKSVLTAYPLLGKQVVVDALPGFLYVFGGRELFLMLLKEQFEKSGVKLASYAKPSALPPQEDDNNFEEYGALHTKALLGTLQRSLIAASKLVKNAGFVCHVSIPVLKQVRDDYAEDLEIVGWVNWFLSF